MQKTKNLLNNQRYVLGKKLYKKIILVYLSQLYAQKIPSISIISIHKWENEIIFILKFLLMIFITFPVIYLTHFANHIKMNWFIFTLLILFFSVIVIKLYLNLDKIFQKIIKIFYYILFYTLYFFYSTRYQIIIFFWKKIWSDNLFYHWFYNWKNDFLNLYYEITKK